MKRYILGFITCFLFFSNNYLNSCDKGPQGLSIIKNVMNDVKKEGDNNEYLKKRFIVVMGVVLFVFAVVLGRQDLLSFIGISPKIFLKDNIQKYINEIPFIKNLKNVIFDKLGKLCVSIINKIKDIFFFNSLKPVFNAFFTEKIFKSWSFFIGIKNKIYNAIHTMN
jgi:hypothetical protein